MNDTFILYSNADGKLRKNFVRSHADARRTYPTYYCRLATVGLEWVCNDATCLSSENQRNQSEQKLMCESIVWCMKIRIDFYFHSFLRAPRKTLMTSSAKMLSSTRFSHSFTDRSGVYFVCARMGFSIARALSHGYCLCRARINVTQFVYASPLYSTLEYHRSHSTSTLCRPHICTRSA